MSSVSPSMLRNILPQIRKTSSCSTVTIGLMKTGPATRIANKELRFFQTDDLKQHRMHVTEFLHLSAALVVPYAYLSNAMLRRVLELTPALLEIRRGTEAYQHAGSSCAALDRHRGSVGGAQSCRLRRPSPGISWLRL